MAQARLLAGLHPKLFRRPVEFTDCLPNKGLTKSRGEKPCRFPIQFLLDGSGPASPEVGDPDGPIMLSRAVHGTEHKLETWRPGRRAVSLALRSFSVATVTFVNPSIVTRSSR